MFSFFSEIDTIENNSGDRMPGDHFHVPFCLFEIRTNRLLLNLIVKVVVMLVLHHRSDTKEPKDDVSETIHF